MKRKKGRKEERKEGKKRERKKGKERKRKKERKKIQLMSYVHVNQKTGSASTGSGDRTGLIIPLRTDFNTDLKSDYKPVESILSEAGRLLGGFICVIKL